MTLGTSTSSSLEEEKKKASMVIAEYKDIIARLQEQLELEQKRNSEVMAKLEAQQQLVTDINTKNSVQKQGKQLKLKFSRKFKAIAVQSL